LFIKEYLEFFIRLEVFLMRHILLAAILAALVTIGQACIWAADQEPGTLENLVEEEIWIIFAHDPADYLHNAWENFISGNHQDAAYHIRRAKACLKLEAYRAEPEAKDDLEASINELERLIMALEEGSHPTIKAVKKAFAQAEYALAYHHHQKALSYEVKGDHEKMTYALDAAATHLMYGSVWAGRELDQDDAVSAKEARAIARKIRRGEKWSPDRIREALKELGRGIKKFGTGFKQSKEGL
jgi:hypothetical protein